MKPPFNNELSYEIWREKYASCDDAGNTESSIYETWCRVAAAVASVERNDQDYWSERFLELLRDFRFLPGGRILAGAGTSRHVTLFNCFVMGSIEDSMDGIFTALKEGALTMQQGGGVGYDFSSLRPQGAPATHAGTISSGPLSFMRIWDSMCATLLSSGNRRGAMMATLRCDHPDILTFIESKRDSSELRNFNLSVLVSDEFMQAVRSDEEWSLRFPLLPNERVDVVEEAAWPGYAQIVPCRIYDKISARELWNRIMHANYEMAEPGVLFIDRINRENNLYYRERISATNPCGEIPLPPYGACDLGSLNLTAHVSNPFSDNVKFDQERFLNDAVAAVRFLDNVIDLSRFPLHAQQLQARATRRIGLGVTGLANVLMMLGMRYGDETSQEWVTHLFQSLRDVVYTASCDLADEKGVFPALIPETYLKSDFSQRLPATIRRRIAENGLRNSHLLAIAPTGTISLLANNLSSGLEPVFDYSFQRRLKQGRGETMLVKVEDYAWRAWQKTGATDIPQHFVTTQELTPEDHLLIQAQIQPYIDNAISKTINVPETYPFKEFRRIFDRAYDLGLKGCTTYRPSAIRGQVLSSGSHEQGALTCCMTD